MVQERQMGRSSWKKVFRRKGAKKKNETVRKRGIRDCGGGRLYARTDGHGSRSKLYNCPGGSCRVEKNELARRILSNCRPKILLNLGEEEESSIQTSRSPSSPTLYISPFTHVFLSFL